MATAHKGAISFGLVHIPVNLYHATQDNDIRFNQLHKEDKERIRYKKVCGHCGKEVGPADIIKGFEYEKDKYVLVTEEDLEKIKTEKDRSIQIMHFTDLRQVSPIYFEKTYHALPEAGGDKAFELLRAAMMALNKIAIAKTVLGNKETLMAVIPREEGILIQTMYFEDEIKELPKSYQKTEVKDAELKMAEQLITSMEAPFDPSQYEDEYQERLRELISKKIAGQEVVAPEPEAAGTVIDLMDALQTSLEKNKTGDQNLSAGRKAQ